MFKLRSWCRINGTFALLTPGLTVGQDGCLAASQQTSSSQTSGKRLSKQLELFVEEQPWSPTYCRTGQWRLGAGESRREGSGWCFLRLQSGDRDTAQSGRGRPCLSLHCALCVCSLSRWGLGSRRGAKRVCQPQAPAHTGCLHSGYLRMRCSLPLPIR